MLRLGPELIILVGCRSRISFQKLDDDRIQHCSSIATRSRVQKRQDPGAFTIPCKIRLIPFSKGLCDLSASINLMPLSIDKKLGFTDTAYCDAVTNGQSNNEEVHWYTP